MSSTSPEGRTLSSGGSSGGRKVIYASLLILLLAGIAGYFRLTPRITALAAGSSTKSEVAKTQPLTTGSLQETLRLTGTIGAERLQA